ncbi:hypothetical protein Patl1_34531 [Pistacia atlantica]|uniref:Uncharacterized protein n=1 Tax=Pistacia atlantica TaxID=434234 RepID=A0ACC0ZSG1_9ROSI|nr:hypothetical protein Patl1_34531 [Pistacia atlantica]
MRQDCEIHLKLAMYGESKHGTLEICPGTTGGWRCLHLEKGWHNNHHAFEFSARHGLEWWQVDMTWYVVRFLQAIGLASDVKLPSELQKQRMAFKN